LGGVGVGSLTTLGVGVGFLTTLEVGVGYFCSTPTRDAQLDQFYITLLNWEFLLKWSNFY